MNTTQTYIIRGAGGQGGREAGGKGAGGRGQGGRGQGAGGQGAGGQGSRGEGGRGRGQGMPGGRREAAAPGRRPEGGAKILPKIFFNCYKDKF